MKTDCHSIIAQYKKHGIDFLPKLRGMFAFSLFDSDKQEVIIARDPVGIIPLY